MQSPYRSISIPVLRLRAPDEILALLVESTDKSPYKLFLCLTLHASTASHANISGVSDSAGFWGVSDQFLIALRPS